MPQSVTMTTNGRFSHLPVLLPMLALAACQAGGSHGATVPGDGSDTHPFAAIGEGETVRFTGTEPFWGGTAHGGNLIYSTPEQPHGQAIAVRRFAGRGGLSFSGTLPGQSFDMMVTQGECSDGMSDRRYPFTVTLKIGAETRNGCAWTDGKPFSGPANP